MIFLEPVNSCCATACKLLSLWCCCCKSQPQPERSRGSWGAVSPDPLSLDWFQVKSTGNHGIMDCSMKSVPVDFLLNQSNDTQRLRVSIVDSEVQGSVKSPGNHLSNWTTAAVMPQKIAVYDQGQTESYPTININFCGCCTHFLSPPKNWPRRQCKGHTPFESNPILEGCSLPNLISVA